MAAVTLATPLSSRWLTSTVRLSGSCMRINASPLLRCCLLPQCWQGCQTYVNGNNGFSSWQRQQQQQRRQLNADDNNNNRPPRRGLTTARSDVDAALRLVAGARQSPAFASGSRTRAPLVDPSGSGAPSPERSFVRSTTHVSSAEANASTIWLLHGWTGPRLRAVQITGSGGHSEHAVAAAADRTSPANRPAVLSSSAVTEAQPALLLPLLFAAAAACCRKWHRV